MDSIEIKSRLRTKINAIYGSQTNFIRRKPNLRMSTAQLNDVLNPKKDCRISTIERVCKELGLNIAVL